MKKVSFLLFVMLILGISSCKEEDEFFQYDAPEWRTQAGDYSESMTAIIDLPNSIKPYFQETDEMAVFLNDECRGTATIVDGLFFINILGSPSEMSTLTIRYYSSKNRYKYEQVTDIMFEPNKVVGSYDSPYVPVFLIM